MDALRKRPFLLVSVLLAVLPGCAPTASPAGGETPLQPVKTAKPTAGPAWANRLIDVGAGDHDGRLFGEDPAPRTCSWAGRGKIGKKTALSIWRSSRRKRM